MRIRSAIEAVRRSLERDGIGESLRETPALLTMTRLRSTTASFGGAPVADTRALDRIDGSCRRGTKLPMIADRIQVREVYDVTGRTNTRMLRLFKEFGFDVGPEADPTLLVATKTMT